MVEIVPQLGIPGLEQDALGAFGNILRVQHVGGDGVGVGQVDDQSGSDQSIDGHTFDVVAAVDEMQGRIYVGAEMNAAVNV